MKNYFYAILNITILVLLIIFIFSTLRFLDFFISIYPNLNISEVFSRIAPPLLGAFFSGIVAILVFYLTKLKEDFTKKSQSKMFLEIIDNEIIANIKSIEKIFEIIKSTPPKDLAQIINTNPETSERFKILSSNLSNEIVDKFLVQLNKNDYVVISEKVKNYKSILNFLELLNNNVTEVTNKEIVIDKLKNLVNYFDNLPIKNKSKKQQIRNLFSSLPTTTQNLIIIFLIVIINSFFNILLIKIFL